MQSYQDLLQSNKSWAIAALNEDKNYFEKLAAGQAPPFLMLTCSDSRISLGTMANSGPGEIFMHRNIANQAQLNDLGFMASLEFAVKALGVKHIIVMGHTECGGIKAALKGKAPALVNSWLGPVYSLYAQNRKAIDRLGSAKLRQEKLIRLNVIKQVENILASPVVQKAMKKKKTRVRLHGWIFEIKKGFITELSLPIKEFKEKQLLPAKY